MAEFLDKSEPNKFPEHRKSLFHQTLSRESSMNNNNYAMNYHHRSRKFSKKEERKSSLTKNKGESSPLYTVRSSSKPNFGSYEKLSRNLPLSVELPYLSNNSSNKSQSSSRSNKSSRNLNRTESPFFQKSKFFPGSIDSFVCLTQTESKELVSRDLLKECKLVKQKSREKLLKTRSLNSQIISILVKKYPGYKKPICSNTSTGVLKTFGVNTYKGLVKSENENRVTILMNISKPKNFQGEWPENLSMFGIFDGHSGTGCSNYLRDKAHLYIINSVYFPNNIDAAIRDAFKKLDNEFIEKIAVDSNGNLIDQSGSCAIIILFVDNDAYVINLGNSRAILSANKGKEIIQLSNDHNPNEPTEKLRILDNDGNIYKLDSLNEYRITPGNLSASRAFGDASSKLAAFGGKPGVIISNPEVKKIKINESKMDFILLGNQGIFGSLTNEEIVENIFGTLGSKNIIANSPHIHSGICADIVIKAALEKKSKENLAAIFIGFEAFAKTFQKKRERINKKLFNDMLNMMEIKGESTNSVKQRTDEVKKQKKISAEPVDCAE